MIDIKLYYTIVNRTPTYAVTQLSRVCGTNVPYSCFEFIKELARRDLFFSV